MVEAQDERVCERPECGHGAGRHASGIPEMQPFRCMVEGCECGGWLYRDPADEGKDEG